jgi:hypothetical protein
MGHPAGNRPVSSATKRRALACGPLGWLNWRAYQLGTRRSGEAFETAIYSDTRFVDELLDLGPYKIFNTVPMDDPAPGSMALALVLRVEEYGRAYIDPHPPMEAPTLGTYHGGGIADEIAALMSLALGVRFTAGEMTRRFGATKDRGTPTQWRTGPPWPSVPGLQRALLPPPPSVNLDEARGLLKSYPSVAPSAATALLRAARQYQRALLIAEIDPNMAWLQLVSAVEVAAVFHTRADTAESPWQLVKAGLPEVAEHLKGLRVARRDSIAALLAPQARAAARYRRFLRDHRAPPPPRRPEPYARMNWSASALSKAVHKIYEHRSVALHQGVPFPSPLCAPPWNDDNKIPAETMFALGAGSGDAYWPRSELPMHLHVYAYIVASALKAWWTELAGSTSRSI